jgi:biopolymer transport protein ExbD
VQLGPDIDDDALAETHEINVTPFIDVMLVLLIIFMVAAPLATVDVAVNLPSASAAPQPRPDKPVFLTVLQDLSLVLGEAPVERPMLAAALDAATGSERETQVYLRADKSVSYENLMEALNLLRDSGYRKVALVGLEQAR